MKSPLIANAMICIGLVLGFIKSPNAAQLELERVSEESKGTVLVFKDSNIKPFQTGLYDAKYLGIINGATPQATYYLMTGKTCKDCKEEKAVYMIKADGKKTTQFVYPGTIVDPKTGQVLLESRAFFGKCLANYGEVYAVFQKERVDRRHKLQTSVFVAVPNNDFIQEKLIEKRLPNLSWTSKQVKTKNCWEVEGRKRQMLAKPLDLKPRRGDDDEQEDEEEPTKENQTQEELGSTPAQ